VLDAAVLLHHRSELLACRKRRHIAVLYEQKRVGRNPRARG
jgi:hypothetical protein